MKVNVNVTLYIAVMLDKQNPDDENTPMLVALSEEELVKKVSKFVRSNKAWRTALKKYALDCIDSIYALNAMLLGVGETPEEDEPTRYLVLTSVQEM